MLVAAPGLTAHLPASCLAAIVIVACLGIVDVAAVMRMARLRPSEAALSVVCFLGVAVLGVVPGIIASVGVALIAFVWRAWRPYHAVLGRVDGVKGYHDVTRYPDARRIPGLVLFRWDAPLFFANSGMFREHVLEAVAASEEPARWVAVAAEPVTDIDLTAADMLGDLLDELDDVGVTLVWGELKDPVKDRLRQYGLFARIGETHFYPTLGSVVDGYLDTSGIDWVDWEERAPT
jgi:MFS superfamily sulfate permease-like transporter